MVISENRGTPYIYIYIYTPKYYIILLKEPKKGTPIFGNPQIVEP